MRTLFLRRTLLPTKVLCYNVCCILQVVLKYIILFRQTTEVHTPEEEVSTRKSEKAEKEEDLPR